jgi:hypothetical protein
MFLKHQYEFQILQLIWATHKTTSEILQAQKPLKVDRLVSEHLRN